MTALNDFVFRTLHDSPCQTKLLCTIFFNKMPFSSKEKRDMLKLYYKFDRNSTKTAQMYFKTYPERHQPD